MKKRIAAAMLCLMMIFTVIPLTSSAENAAAEVQPMSSNGVKLSDWEIQDAWTKEIGIGINLYYHCKGYSYWYPDSQTGTPSYHKYPNEPITIWHATLRARKDDGVWNIYSNKEPYYRDYYGIRLGQSSAHVRPDFFTSPDAVQVHGNTVGIADPTGQKVKAMLDLEEADYDAIAAAWITWAQDESNGFTSTAANSYFDGYSYYAKSDIDWKQANPEDYTAVPYVIKYQKNDGVWFIDMIIRQKAKYTLGYDRNLDEGFSLPSNTKFPETSTHDAGEIASIVGNPNVTPTNGSGDTATFLYWVDKDGNKYGNGYTMTIPMFEDKVLYAIWNYSNDPKYGNIRITKEVTNLNSDVVDTSGTEFPMTVTLTDQNGTTVGGDFAYTIYDDASAVRSTGTLTSGTEFRLKDKWYIVIRDLPKNTQVTITETNVDHYLARNSPETVTVVAGHTTLATMENIYARLPYGIRWYTVEHYFQDEQGIYPSSPNAEERIQVNQDETTMTNAQAKTHPRFTLDLEKHPGGVIEQKYIETNGSTVIKIYYARARYPYVVRYLEQGTDKVLRTEDLRDPRLYLTTVTETAPAIDGYTLTSAPQQSLVIQEDGNIITFYYTENDVALRYRVAGGGGTVSPDSETVKAVTGSAAGSVPSEDPGYRFKGWYLDEACTQPVPASWVTGTHLYPQNDRTPGTPYTAATYYAKFDCIVGNLEVNKTVTKAYAADVIPAEDLFFFTVSLEPEAAAFSDRTYSYTVSIGTHHFTGTMVQSDDTIVFSLKNGETAVISGLPLGSYQVTEAEVPGYTPREHAGTSGTITPGGTAAAVFHNEYDRHRGNLTITRENAADPDDAQVFVYEVRHNTTGETITVTVVGNGSTTIHDLFVGDWTVTQVNDWSWRYDDPARGATVVAGETASTTFGKEVADNKWLDGNSPLVKNRFREDSPV